MAKTAGTAKRPAIGYRRRNISKHLGALKVLNSLGPINLQALLPHLNSGLQKSICECAHNVVNNSKNILSSKKIKHLKPKLIKHKSHLKKLTQPKLKSRDRNNHLIQTGGSALSEILKVAVPALVGLVSAL